MWPPDRVRMQHMIEAIESGLRFVRGRTRGDLQTDEMLAFALIRAVEIVGEAASRVSESGRERLPGVPWVDIVSMRTRVIHAYFDVNEDILWATVTESFPALLRELQSALSRESS